MSYNIYLSLSDLFHSIRQFLDPPRLLQMALLHCFYGQVIFHRVCVPHLLYPSSVDRHIGRRKGWSSGQTTASFDAFMSLQLGSSWGKILSQDFLKIAHFTEGNPVCRKMFWKNCKLSSIRREAWKECGAFRQRVGSASTVAPLHGAPCHLLSASPYPGQREGTAFSIPGSKPRNQGCRQDDTPVRILIPGWMRADLTTPGPELEPELLSASWLWWGNRSLSPSLLKYVINYSSW